MKNKSLTNSFILNSDKKENKYSSSYSDNKVIQNSYSKLEKTSKSIFRIPLEDITDRINKYESKSIYSSHIMNQVDVRITPFKISNSSKKLNIEAFNSSKKYKLMR